MTVPQAGSAARLARADLVKLLSETLGAEKASEAIDAEAAALGMADVTHFNRAQLLKLLEKMASSPGLVGIVARFAKVRIILQLK